MLYKVTDVSYYLLIYQLEDTIFKSFKMFSILVECYAFIIFCNVRVICIMAILFLCQQMIIEFHSY